MECKSCGSPTDPILSECQHCGNTIKGVDLNSISTEEVIRRANKWIGLLENQALGGGIVGAGIKSKVNEYLGLLDMRADKDALAKRKFSQLKQEYKAAVDNIEKEKKKKEKREKRYARNAGIVIIIIFIILPIIMAIAE
jgi:hypothetical protein